MAGLLIRATTDQQIARPIWHMRQIMSTVSFKKKGTVPFS